MKLIPLCLSLMLLFLSSCVIVNTPGFYSGYKKLSPAQKSQVVFTSQDKSVCNISNDKRVYAITGAQLLQCMKENDTSLVYLWSPNCHSGVCISLNAAQYYCDKRGYKLYVVAEYYDFEKMTPQNTNPSPIFSINHQYYKTDYCNKYQRLFTKDMLQGKKLGKEDKFSRFLFFKKDQLVFTRMNLMKKV